MPVTPALFSPRSTGLRQREVVALIQVKALPAMPATNSHRRNDFGRALET